MPQDLINGSTVDIVVLRNYKLTFTVGRRRNNTVFRLARLQGSPNKEREKRIHFVSVGGQPWDLDWQQNENVRTCLAKRERQDADGNTSRELAGYLLVNLHSWFSKIVQEK